MFNWNNIWFGSKSDVDVGHDSTDVVVSPLTLGVGWIRVILLSDVKDAAERMLLQEASTQVTYRFLAGTAFGRSHEAIQLITTLILPKMDQTHQTLFTITPK